jgi:hypothetical protein
MTDGNSCSACGSKWTLPVLLALVLGAILFSQSRRIREAVFKPPAAPPNVETAASSTQQVLLTINFGDGRALQNEESAWREGMTVLDLLQGQHNISFRSEGSGESTFLNELNGIENEGAAGRNWMYSVNGKRADRSIGAYQLRPNDHVLWTFTGPD